MKNDKPSQENYYASGGLGSINIGQLNSNKTIISNDQSGHNRETILPARTPKRLWNVFINYRRETSTDIVQLLYQYLVPVVDTVFYDLEAMKPGDFPSQLAKAIKDCDIFLSVVSQSTFNRLHNSDDWVRKEIERALKLEKTIVPIILPPEEKFPSDGIIATLPVEIQPLFNFAGMILKYPMDKSVEELIAFLEHQHA